MYCAGQIIEANFEKEWWSGARLSARAMGLLWGVTSKYGERNTESDGYFRVNGAVLQYLLEFCSRNLQIQFKFAR